MNIVKLLAMRKVLIEKKLDAVLPKETTPPTRLHKAMRYSVLAGGKRMRPILAVESCLCCGGDINDVIDAACAIELLHTFSLIQDDLPAMDNDDYRRGKPSCHKKFDEATAILAADALMALAFEVVSTGRDAKTAVMFVRGLAGSIGSLGIAGGQCVDIEYEGKRKSPEVLNYINSHKTGALIRASAKIGAQASGAALKKINAIERFGRYIGEAFQIVDDILDGGGSVSALGDASRAIRKARVLTKMAKDSLKDFRDSADVLKALADYLTERRF